MPPRADPFLHAEDRVKLESSLKGQINLNHTQTFGIHGYWRKKLPFLVEAVY